MRKRALRLFGLVAAGLLLLAAAPVTPAPAATDPVWASHCDSGAAGRFCTLRAEGGFYDNRGALRAAGLVLHVDRHCVSLHVELPRGVDEARPTWLQLDGGAPLPFYRPAELKELADALDARRPPRVAAPEMSAFWQEAQAGALGSEEAATAELLARFARLRQGGKLGIGCEATARLLPALQKAGTLRIGFFTPPSGAEPYHWAARDRRELIVQLGDLRTVLESLPLLH